MVKYTVKMAVFTLSYVVFKWIYILASLQLGQSVVRCTP